MAKIIKADGTITEVKPQNGNSFTLDELYNHTNSTMVEIVRTNDDRLIVIDEDGKMKQKNVNQKATDLYVHKEHDFIVGDALVCSIDEID